MKAAPAMLTLLLLACNRQAAQDEDNNQIKVKLLAPPGVKIPAAKPFVYDEKNDLIDYHVAWSAEAAAVPQLVERFRAAMDKDKAELLKNAKADKVQREERGFPL